MKSARQWYANLSTRVRVRADTVLALALGGIIGNRSDAVLLWAANEGPTWLAAAANSPLATAGTGAVTTVLGLVVGWRLRRRVAQSREQALMSRIQEIEAVGQKAELLLRLDAELIRSMPELLNRQQREQTIRRLAREWIRECAAIFAPDVSRVTLLRPVDDSWLEPWEAFGMPESSLRGRRFFIGQTASTAQRRGVAGAAYVSGVHRVVHVGLNDGVWRGDDDEYVEFEQTPFPRYCTFIAIPIRSERGNMMGVLCLDSKTPGIFDQEPLIGLLLALGQRIGMAVAQYEILREFDLG